MTYVLQAMQARAGEFISLRRNVHRHLELAFHECRTARLVADEFEGWGYAVQRVVGGSGVAGSLMRGCGTRRLGIRAAMDALPISEASGAEWSSVHAGVMHACGRDGHTAMLLAAVRYLAEQGSFDGTLHLTFLPADPIVVAASIVMTLQATVSRNMDPLQAAVVTVGALSSGAANNVTPAQAKPELSVRARDHPVRATLERRIKALVAAQAESLGVQAQVDWRPGYAVLVNTPAAAAFACDVATDLVGAGRVTPQGPPLTAREDFAFMLQRVPGSYVLIGNGTDGSPGAGDRVVHNPGCDLHEDNVATGSAYGVLLAERFLAKKEQVTLQ